MTLRRTRAGTIVASGFIVLALAQSSAFQSEPVDAAMNAKIRDEGLNRSQVASVFDMFVTAIGPRLTGSPAYKRAADFARDTLAKWNLANVREEPWEFGRGWTLDRYTLEMIEPRYFPLTGFPEAWSPSTPGDIVARAVMVAGKTPEEVEAMRAQGVLENAAILSQAVVTNFITADRVQPTSQPDAPATPAAAPGAGAPGRGRGNRGAGAGTPTSAQRIDAAIRAGGARVLLRPSRGQQGTLFVQAGRDNPTDQLPKIVLIGEHYNMIARLLQQNIPVKLRVNVQSRFLDADRNSYNVIAEIPGADPALKDQVVMLGAHLDSWHTGTGATDNADGSAVAMEAFRILKAIGAQPRRTVRLAIWGGEEEGLLGSKAYVRDHLEGDANKADRDKMSVYFNVDPGKGPIYGWYMENNDDAKAVFDAWLAPFKDLGAVKNVRQGIGNTDHLSFIAAGVPGFNVVQDYADYDVRLHHTNADTFERVNEQDLKQSAVVLASFVYHAAMRVSMIPSPVRK